MNSFIESVGMRVPGRVSLAPESGMGWLAASAVAGETKKKGDIPMKYRFHILGTTPVNADPVLSSVGFFDIPFQHFAFLIRTGGCDEERPPG